LSNDVPSATVVQGGKLGGDVPKGNAAPARQPYKRKLGNFMLDKKLQLRYVLLVTVLSALISASLGYLIYHQRHSASESIERDLAALTHNDASLAEFQNQVADDMAADDRALVYKMVGVGLGLVIILSAYLVIMTHKVAGPLFKVSMYFDRMAEVGHLHAALHAVGRLHRDRAHAVFAEVLLDFADDVDRAGLLRVVRHDPQRVVDLRQVARLELDVHDRPDHLNNLPDVVSHYSFPA